MSLVSVLIPAYNASEYLRKCLESVIAQTHRNLQIVLIDDGSTDETWSIAQEFASRDSRIEAYTQPNQGVAQTRNNLLNKITGDYFLFIDADDWIEPDMIEQMLKLILDSGAEIAMCSRVINDAPVNKLSGRSSVWTKEAVIEKFLFHKELIGSLCNKLVTTSLLHKGAEAPRFDPSISYGEDALFCWQLLKRGVCIINTDRQLYHYRMTPNSISHSPFGPKKLSGHKVWETINADVAEYYPQYINIAQARFAMEDMYLLRDASQRGYRYGDDIRQLQETVKTLFPEAQKIGLATRKDSFYSNIITHWYSFGKVYLFLHKLKKKVRRAGNN